uniref:WH2 domain-containing protein n=1 Tax=Pyxicephalus adspersus TaxID=30357 RepID=A0AAV3B3H9_PYXAD|nr:TPA: hypothetical protein GDO54_007579 [Pyxicephalus adspersus]
MEGERMDSLDGWVAVRPNVFEEAEHYKLGFIVAWNQVESKFAVTCHNRTLQRRRRREEEDGQGERDSWAGLYSVPDLEHIHHQLSSVCSVLEPCLPSLPTPSAAGSLWTLLFPGEPTWEAGPEELDAVCRALELYLGAAVEHCGRKIVLDVLFPEELQDDERYFESLHEFRRKSLEEHVTRAKEDLRRKSLEMNDFGPKRIAALQKEAEQWNTRAEEAVCSIQSVTVNYFKETSKALAAMQKQMEQDQKRFGQATWASALPRLERIKSLLAKETLQHMRTKEMCLNQKKTDIKQKMENLSEGVGAMALVDELELQYYETQLELYDVQCEILKYEEMLLTAELASLRRQMKEKEDEVVYYDTCEDPQELQAYTQSHNNSNSTYLMLRGKTQQLESKRGKICARRALLRNKKDQCIQTQELKLKQYEETQKRLQQHHSIQMKRDKKKEEERKRKEWVDQERQKTLNRLRSFKDNKESPVIRKTLRIQSRLPSNSSENLNSLRVTKPNRSPADIAIQNFAQKGNVDQEIPTNDTTNQSKTFSPLPAPPPPPPPPPPPLPPHLLPPPPPLPPMTVLLSERAPLPRSTKTLNQRETELMEVENKSSQKASPNQCLGSMEEVLASLKRGESLLRRADQPQTITDVRDSILTAIRQGVKLRKVHKEPVNKDPENELERSIKAAMQRMKNASADSDDEERSEYMSGDWDT